MTEPKSGPRQQSRGTGKTQSGRPFDVLPRQSRHPFFFTLEPVEVGSLPELLDHIDISRVVGNDLQTEFHGDAWSSQLRGLLEVLSKKFKDNAITLSSGELREIIRQAVLRGWSLGANHITLDVVFQAISETLIRMTDEGLLNQQARLRVTKALRTAANVGLAAIPASVQKNLPKTVEYLLENEGAQPGEPVSLAVRKKLARQLDTTLPTIRDAISKTKYRIRKKRQA